MNTKEVWMGEPNAYNYFPVLKDNDELIYFNDIRFIDMLLSKTSLVKFGENDGKIYERNGEIF